jgi:putative membrane protein
MVPLFMQPNPSNIPSIATVFAEDPRVIMAAERTLLAWIRTGLALMGFGFLVARFGLFMQEYAIIQGSNADSPAWSVWIGASLVLLGTLITSASGLLHGRHLRHVSSTSLHFRGGYTLAIACAFGLALIGAFMCFRLLML